MYKLPVFVLQLLKNEFTFHYLHYRLASVASVPVRLNNRNDRTTGTMERDRKRYRAIHLLCFTKVFFFNLQTPTGRSKKKISYFETKLVGFLNFFLHLLN